MESITSWVRLEPRARDADLLAGVEARLHDPLWLLARQWQLGELTGADAGSAVFARTRADVARINATRGGIGGDWNAFDPDTTPLTAALAPAADEPSARPPLYRRARAGRQLLRMLSAASLPDGTLFTTKFPLTITAAERATLDDADVRFLAAMNGRVPDSDAAAAALAPLLPTDTSQLPDSFGVPSARIAAVSTVCRAWLTWRAALEHTSGSPAWQPDELAYRFQARVAATGHDIILTAPHQTQPAIRAWDLDASNGDAARQRATPVVSTSIPTRARYRGAPAPRYWELEDASVHWPSIDAGPGDIARILFVEFGLVFADHWLTVPLQVPAGSLSVITSLVVTDTFGVRSLVRTAADLDGTGTPWRFLEVSRPANLPGPLLCILPANADAAGPVLEAEDFASDDVSDVLWAIDRTLLGADGRPRDVPITAAPAPAATTLPAYRLGPPVLPSYHPYRARLDTDGLSMALASVPGVPATVARADLPQRIRSHALASAPQRLSTQSIVGRAADGSYHSTAARDLVRTTAPAAPQLVFDDVEEVP